MTLRKKTFIIIGIALIGLLVVMSAASTTILTHCLVAAERENATESARRVAGLFSQLATDIETPAADWSKWNDSYAFVQGSNPRFAETNLTDDGISTLRLNLLVFLDRNARVVFGTGFDLKRKARTALPPGIEGYLRPGSILLNHRGEAATGLLVLPQGPLMVVARPILDSRGQGPSRGTLIFGRCVDQEVISRLSTLSRLPLAVEWSGNAPLPPRLRAVAAQLSAASPVAVRPLSEETIAGYILLRDLRGRPGLILRLDMPRDIHREGHKTIHYFSGVLLAAGVLFSLLILLLLEKGVLARLAELSSGLSLIGGSDDLSARVPVQGCDELSDLARGINDILDSVERSHESLKMSEERFRSVAQSATDAIISADRRGKVVFWNAAAEAMFGYTAEEVCGRPISMLVPERLRARHEQGLARLLATGEAAVLGQRRELTGLRKDGRKFAMELSLTTWKTAEGLFITGIARDISERKQAEEELRQAKEAAEEDRADMESLNQQLEEAIGNANLLALEAEAANVAKSQFLANMSHEIRTPLNGIAGLTELTLDTQLSAEQREYLQMVRTSADLLMKVINDILDFSKIEAEKLELEMTPFDLRDTVGDALKALSLSADEKGLELACRVLPNVPDAVVGDPYRLRQVVFNLLSNAIKFTERGEVALQVEQVLRGEDQVELHVSVRDTGLGIAPGKQAVIFNAFCQADSSTTRKFGGTGLGLAISSRLIKAMGGRIWVESKPGQGTTFHFTTTLDLPTGEASGLPAPLPEELRGLRVLVADDNPTSRLILEEILCAWGMEPRVVEGGEAALRELGRAASAGAPYPVAVLDYFMPDLDGFALAERIGEDRELAGATVMMLSSLDLQGDAGRCRELGVAAYLTKPVKHSDLLRAITAALQVAGRQAGGEAKQPHGEAAAWRPLRILLAEDNKINQRLAVRMLEKRGHSVVVADDGEAALSALAENEFDIVLMDVQMPRMDGFAATEAIRWRERATGAHLPIVAMTAHAMREYQERCLQAGMDAYVSKPIEPQRLFETIERLVLPASGAPPEAAAAAQTWGQAFDRAELLDRVDGDEELLAELVGIFLEDAPRQMAALKEAMEQGDITLVERQAHSLKGAAANIGARPLSAEAHRLELAAREGNLARDVAVCGRLEQELAKLSTILSD